MFSKAFFSRYMKTRDCLGKGYPRNALNFLHSSNPLPDNKILALSKLRVVAGNSFNVDKI